MARIRSRRRAGIHGRSLGGTCRVVTVHGTRRVLCWDRNGRIRSNKAKKKG